MSNTGFVYTAALIMFEQWKGGKQLLILRGKDRGLTAPDAKIPVYITCMTVIPKQMSPICLHNHAYI